jgi:uncharacterized membrane protein
MLALFDKIACILMVLSGVVAYYYSFSKNNRLPYTGLALICFAFAIRCALSFNAIVLSVNGTNYILVVPLVVLVIGIGFAAVGGLRVLTEKGVSLKILKGKSLQY